MLENLPKVPRAADSKFRIGARFSTVPSKANITFGFKPLAGFFWKK